MPFHVDTLKVGLEEVVGFFPTMAAAKHTAESLASEFKRLGYNMLDCDVTAKKVKN